MKALHNHIILSIIAIVATNVYYVMWLLIDNDVVSRQILDDLSFYEFVGITNGALMIISFFSITYKRLGDNLLKWGYSNFFRFITLVIVSLLVFIAASVALFTVHFTIKGTEDIYFSVGKSIRNSYYIPLVFFFGLTSILMFFISNLERRSGDIFRLFSQSMGQTLKPKLTQRGFMFIDLNDATSLAEKLGSEKYAQLLRDCFHMLNELVAFSPFEVYQYVGDEAVITWKSDILNADMLAIDLFADFKAYLLEKELAFRKAYGIRPRFKCAIHGGQVVQSEIGREVKHLVYHGDVLNTTSRLLSRCHRYKTDMIISQHTLKNKEKIEQNYTLEPMAYNDLKGKENTVIAFIVSETKTRRTEKKQHDFFLQTNVTDSHLSILNFKTMKTFKKALFPLFMGAVLISCGDEPQEQAAPQQKTDTKTSQSTVQVVRQSDLEVQTIINTTVQSNWPITGRIIPKYTTQLVAEVQGRVISTGKPFKAGTIFRKGEVILRMDSREFALNLESQKSAFLNILTGMMPDLKADYPENYQNWLDYVNSYQTGEPLPPLPQTQSNSEKYFATSRQVYNTYYSIKAQEERLGKFTLRAPYTGSLSVAMVDNGGLVSPGQPLGTFISEKDFEIESAVKLELAQNLRIGQKIEFYSNSLGKTFTATIARINNIVDPNTQNIPVFLRVTDKHLRSGMYLEGEVLSGTFENAINIPATAVNRDNTVHIIDNGVIKKEKVQIVKTGVNEVIIRGLKDNSQLVLNTFQNPVSGLKITK